ncbi:hypothetical protein AMELA_G00003470 [Ameiurus melas]|uniref:ascorbate ferrireductase (transmembrane) n=1 Tax=Ameiurus melas TaxID=219545 RepID=A0A7J6BEP1_AMEME|nr:hypothetical protein AMELA_G00003470 [Ameiurus melas]
MRQGVEYSPVGEGLGMREYWLYACMRKISLVTAHCVALGFTVLIGVLSRPGTSLFSWHPLCMSLGFCLCMTEGILLFSGEGFKKKLSCFTFCSMGLGFMVASKRKSEHPHLETWHSLLGVGTLVATVLQATCGVCLLFPKLTRNVSVSRLRLYHATCGLVAYLLATVTVTAALFSDWFQATVNGPIWYAFLLLPPFPALVVMNQITNTFLPKKKLTT